MTRGRREGDAYRFPWSDAAKDKAVELATLHEGAKHPMRRIPYRVIAAELHRRGFVPTLPDPATVRRLVVRQLGKARAAR